MTGPSHDGFSVAFSPDGDYVVFAAHDGAINVWELQQADAERRLLVVHTERINKVKVSPDSRYALSADRGGIGLQPPVGRLQLGQQGLALLAGSLGLAVQ